MSYSSPYLRLLAQNLFSIQVGTKSTGKWRWPFRHHCCTRQCSHSRCYTGCWLTLSWCHNFPKSCSKLFSFLSFKAFMGIRFPCCCLQLSEMQRSTLALAPAFLLTGLNSEHERGLYSHLSAPLWAPKKRHLLLAIKAIHFCMEEGDKHFLWLVEGAPLGEKTTECYWLCGLTSNFQ